MELEGRGKAFQGWFFHGILIPQLGGVVSEGELSLFTGRRVGSSPLCGKGLPLDV
jgi:hypothetical protein